MGEVGGSFNERKNEITRKLRIYPTKSTNSVLKKGRRSSSSLGTSTLGTQCLLILQKEAYSDNSKNIN